jgi:hypothetical protein
VGAEFQPEKILAVLEKHHVAYVLIGGFAATIHGSPYVTSDVDITPDRGRDNLGRLSAALSELGARIRTEGEPEGIAFGHDAESLNRSELLNLTTRYGDLDIALTPAGTTGYADLRRDAIDLEVLGVNVPVASLADVVRSKAAAGRPKDELVLPTLRRLLDESS